MKAVETEGLSKIYTGGNKAVDNISFCLEQGEVFGFLGPNGAGKTTTIKLLNGMLAPSGGSCRVFDIDPAQNPEKLHQMSGVITEHAQMYDHLSGMDNLIFYGTLFGRNKADCEKRAMALLERLDLADAKQRKLSAYSTGMRQRLSLARAMMHSPKILFLDEPTSGLDPESAQNVNTLIQELASDGTTIFLCTHQLRYAQEICTTYGLMNQGNLFATGNIEKLRSMVSDKVKVRVKASCIPEDMECEKIGEHTYDISVNSEEEIPLLVRRIVGAGGDLYQVSAEQLSLEEIYFSLIDKNHAETECGNL
ncbi:MAG: ABC transporter ATP-binding protein [Acetatifactor sp.]